MIQITVLDTEIITTLYHLHANQQRSGIWVVSYARMLGDTMIIITTQDRTHALQEVIRFAFDWIDSEGAPLGISVSSHART